MKELPVLLATSLFLAGCLGPLDDAGSEAPDVMVTHYPIAFLANEIAGDNLTINLFVEGTQAHDYEPTFHDRRDLEDARLVVYQGAGFDPWVDDLLHAAGDQAPASLRLADTTARLIHDTHDDHQDHEGQDHARTDPHTWTDPTKMIDHAHALNESLSQQFPEHEDHFRNQTETLVSDLETLHDDYRTDLQDCEIRTLVVNHNAFAYLGVQYNLTIEAVHGLSPDTEPSARSLDRLVSVVDEHNITTVFFESFASPTVIEAIAEETGAQTDVLFPLEALSEDQRDRGDDYLSLMETNLGKLADALRCTPPDEAGS